MEAMCYYCEKIFDRKNMVWVKVTFNKLRYDALVCPSCAKLHKEESE